MASSETYDRLSSIMRDIFKDPTLSARPELAARDVERWDSLSHIRFILQIERNFKIKFATAEISRFKNVGELAELIEEKTR